MTEHRDAKPKRVVQEKYVFLSKRIMCGDGKTIKYYADL